MIAARVEILFTAAGGVWVLTAHDGGGDLVVIRVGTRPKVSNIIFVLEL